jgi:hypothetical protein
MNAMPLGQFRHDFLGREVRGSHGGTARLRGIALAKS